MNTRVTKIPAPVAGIVRDRSAGASDPRGAEVVENYFPTTRGLAIRGGAAEVADLAAPVTALFSRHSGLSATLFAATAGAVHNISALDGTSVVVSQGHTGGLWSAQQIGTAGGEFIVAVAPGNYAQVYTGAAFSPLSGEAIGQISYTGLVGAFTPGATLTGGTSGATATIYGWAPGVVRIGAVTGGPFVSGEGLSDGAATATSSSLVTALSALTITGIDTRELSHVWLYRNRLFFVRRNTLKAVFLPVGSVGGAVADLSLSGVFQRGGALLFGATWSSDTGSGLDDRCVFVSAGGEVAVFEGSDPASATDWRLVGRYDMAPPLGKLASMQVGGDLMIATKDGILSLSEVVVKDPAALSVTALTRRIEPIWGDETRDATGLGLVKWPDEGLAFTCIPGGGDMLTVNLKTAAWGVQTGWGANCGASYLGNAYIGRGDNTVWRLDTGGTDNGTPFTARYCHTFQPLGSGVEYKQAQVMRIAYFAPAPVVWVGSISANYRAAFPAAPSASPDILAGYMVWGTDNWGAALWGGGAAQVGAIVSNFRTVHGVGLTMAPTVQVTSGGAEKLSFELIHVDIGFEVGGVVV